METREAFTRLKLSSIGDRCEALDRALDALQSHVHASPASKLVISGIKLALKALKEKLKRFQEDPDLEVLKDNELELRIHTVSHTLPYLHKILALIENSDVNAVPAELTAPIRRKIKDLFPSAEVIIVSSTELNYTIVDIMQYLKGDIWEKLGCQIPEGFPSKILRVSVPSVEHDQALLHCIIAHEIGHALYQENSLQKKIVDFEIPPDYLKRELVAIYSEIAKTKEQSPQGELPFDELEFRQSVTSRVNEVLPGWIQELGADIFGLLLFGPAYLFACVHFSLATGTLDNVSISHPANRLRLKVLFETLDARYPDGTMYSIETSRFLDVWRNIAHMEQQVGVIEAIAIYAIKEHDVLRKLQQEVEATIDAQHIFTKESYSSSLETLCPLIDAYVPPCEFLGDRRYQPAALVGILNAGWERFLSGLDKFRTHLPHSEKLTPFQLTLKFNSFLLKSMELNEAIAAWTKAFNDTHD